MGMEVEKWGEVWSSIDPWKDRKHQWRVGRFVALRSQRAQSYSGLTQRDLPAQQKHLRNSFGLKKNDPALDRPVPPLTEREASELFVHKVYLDEETIRMDRVYTARELAMRANVAVIEVPAAPMNEVRASELVAV